MTTSYYDYVTRRVGAAVAGEEIWVARKRMSVPPAPPLLLASTSPQRRAILDAAAAFRSTSSRRATWSTTRRTPTPAQLVREHALGKARSVAADAGDRPVLGVDTTVALDGRIYAKPADAGDAERMLEELSGRTHAVVSGLALVTPGWEDVEDDGDARHVPRADAARPRELRRRPASGRAAPAATRSRASAPRSSSASRATT